MIIIAKQVDHRLLDRTRYQHSRVFADQQQVGHHMSIARQESGPVAGNVRALGEGMQGKQAVVASFFYLRMQHRDWLSVPTEFPVTLVGGNQRAMLAGPAHAILQRLGIDNLARWVRW